MNHQKKFIIITKISYEGTSKNKDPIKININRKRHQYGSTEWRHIVYFHTPYVNKW